MDLIIFIISFSVLIVSMILIIPSYKYIINLQKEVIMLFLHIDPLKVKKMFNVAESFINKLQA